MNKTLAAILPLLLCVPALAAGDPPKKCRNENLRGQYVFAATGFQRPPNSPPGTPWYPKAILEVMQFSGDGLVTTPVLAIANPPIPPLDSGIVISPLTGGAQGEYSIDDDCSGTVHFFDAGNVTFKVFFDRPRGNLWMIQVRPDNNAIQGIATRVD